MTTAPLSHTLPGTWRLTSRIDRAADGSERAEPNLGADPVALLIYDRAGHFAAQFMRRAAGGGSGPTPAGANNTAAVDGYDAYFGTYAVDDATGVVTQRLEAALSRAHVGVELSRTMTVDGDALVIHLDTTTPAGEPVTRTLTWTRVG